MGAIQPNIKSGKKACDQFLNSKFSTSRMTFASNKGCRKKKLKESVNKKQVPKKLLNLKKNLINLQS